MFCTNCGSSGSRHRELLHRLRQRRSNARQRPPPPVPPRPFNTRSLCSRRHARPSAAGPAAPTTCPWCGAEISGARVELSALRRHGESAANSQRIRLGRTARPQGHGQAPVRQFVLPDRRLVRAGGRCQPRGFGQHLLHASRAAVEGSAVEHHHHVARFRMEAHVRGTAAHHDAGARPRPHRVLARRAGRNDRASAAAGRRGGRARASVHAGHQQRHPTTGSPPTSGTPRNRATTRKRTTRWACSWIASRLRKRRACCCCMPRATCSCAISRPAKPFW